MPNLYISDDQCDGCAYEYEEEDHPICDECLSNRGKANWTPSDETIATCAAIIAMKKD